MARNKNKRSGAITNLFCVIADRRKKANLFLDEEEIGREFKKKQQQLFSMYRITDGCGLRIDRRT